MRPVVVCGIAVVSLIIIVFFNQYCSQHHLTSGEKMNIRNLISDAQRKLSSENNLVKLGEARGIVRALRSLYGDTVLRRVLGTSQLADPVDLSTRADKYISLLKSTPTQSSNSLNRIPTGVARTFSNKMMMH